MILDIFRTELIKIGFKELPHRTIMSSLTYDLGRNRYLAFGNISTPNEMLFIYQSDKDDHRNITDIICLRNFDYDGYTNIETIKSIINLINIKQ